MQVDVLFFASLRKLAGESKIQVSVPMNATLGQLFASLVTRYPALAERRPQLVLAINGVGCGDDHSLSDGDEVALLPPVSGG